jgi:phosphate transport system permease protein
MTSLRTTRTVARVKEQLIQGLLFTCAAVSIFTTIGIIYVLVSGAASFFKDVPVIEFLTGTEWHPLANPPAVGSLPLIWDTLMVAIIAGSIGLPMGLAIAIYLSEYASPRARSILKPTLEILAGIPTIVYGFFALQFVTPHVLIPVFHNVFGIQVGIFNALSAGIVVGIMIIPMVSSLSEDVLQAVPRGLREAAYALGSTRLDVSIRVVVPAALSGIVASFLLAMARAIGETMAVTIAAGQNPSLSLNVFGSIETMTAYIVHVSSGDTEVGSLAERSLYAVGLTLLLMTLAMNVLSQIVQRRFREVYQ